MAKKKKKSKAKSKKKSYKRKEPIDKGGRPTKFKQAYINQIYDLCILGFTDVRIAEFYKIATSTLDNWKKDYPRLMGRMHEARNEQMVQVVKSMYTRATGYSHKESKLFVIKDKIKEKVVDKHYPPETRAGIFLLTNRNPDEWKVDHNVEATIDEPTPVKVILNVVDKRKRG